MQPPTEVRIGTSGWHYKHWTGPFYPEKFPPARMLEFYCRHFDTVEINNSFYRLPPESAVTHWRDSTPAGFRFAMKGSRFLTHMKKLKDPEPGLAKFLNAAGPLAEKLSAIVFQLPPHWALDLPRLEYFVQALPTYHRFAFEFRNTTWNTPKVYSLLNRFNIACCIFDLAGFQSPVELTADFTYIRLHGPGGKYQGSYSEPALENWAARIADWREKLRAVYVYFDNDEAGYAVHDAIRLRSLTAY